MAPSKLQSSRYIAVDVTQMHTLVLLLSATTLCQRKMTWQFSLWIMYPDVYGCPTVLQWSYSRLNTPPSAGSRKTNPVPKHLCPHLRASLTFTVLAMLLHGTWAVGVSQTVVRYKKQNYGTFATRHFQQRAPRIFQERPSRWTSTDIVFFNFNWRLFMGLFRVRKTAYLIWWGYAKTHFWIQTVQQLSASVSKLVEISQIWSDS